MKTIALEQVDQQITDALKHQRREDPILLMKGTEALGLLLRLPEGMRDSGVDGVFWLDEPTGRVLVIMQAKHGSHIGQEVGPARPVFGSCQGMLTIMSEDDEHLTRLRLRPTRCKQDGSGRAQEGVCSRHPQLNREAVG